MGCMRRIGCLVTLVVVAVALWFLRDVLPFKISFSRAKPVTASSEWEPLTADRAERARRALDQLAQPRGPTSVDLRAAELASFIYQQLAKDLPPSADSVEAAQIGERLYVRASVRTSDLGDVTKSLGPFAAILGDRTRMQFGGTFRLIRPGLAEFLVQEIKLGEVSVPSALIPRLLRQIERGSRPEGVSETGLPLVVPPHISDVRVGGGQVTIAKGAA